ncbi:hypothetical protein [Sorangium sp. So ce388]|uniref:hypothetical protein n=1 Tax=Sorangium sp. So ce388 TaxID=3133309 RepID=UPI003F5C7E9F
MQNRLRFTGCATGGLTVLSAEATVVGDRAVVQHRADLGVEQLTSERILNGQLGAGCRQRQGGPDVTQRLYRESPHPVR